MVAIPIRPRNGPSFKLEDKQRAEKVLRLIRVRKVEIDRELAAKCTVRAGLFGRRRYTVSVVNGDQRRKYEKTLQLLQREIERRSADLARS